MKSQKISDILYRIKECLDGGKYRFSQHATERKTERVISLPDILEVLRGGYHEKKKDIWDEKFKTWNYAIRGKTVDKENCRIIISFEDNGLLIITVIRLDGKNL